jgi:hypothetical protein
MSTTTSFSYSFNSVDDVQVNKKIEYQTVYTDENKNIWSTTYVNNVNNDKTLESFNNLYKGKEEIKEKVGLSIDRADWEIKEFDNSVKTNEYNEPYSKYSYLDKIMQYNLANTNINNIDISTIKNSSFPQITL